MKSLRPGIEFFLLKALIAFFCSLDERTALKYGRQLGWLVGTVWRSRARVAERNLEFCGIGSTRAARQAIVRRMFANLGITAAELARLPLYSPEQYRSKLRIENLEHVESGFAHGRGVVFLSGHFGNWEILAPALAARGFPISLVVRQQHNLRADELVNRLRSVQQVDVIPAEAAPRRILKALQAGRGLATLLDIWGGPDGQPAGFFGAAVSTPAGILELALRYRSPILMGFVNRLRDGGLRVVGLPAIVPGEQGCSSVAELVGRYHAELEQAIRARPYLWMWTHKRFKGVIEY